MLGPHPDVLGPCGAFCIFHTLPKSAFDFDYSHLLASGGKLSTKTPKSIRRASAHRALSA